MINTVKKRLDRKGFTLAEVLVTVAIILIIAGVTFVSVAQYQKNLRLMEMDGTAKEIFIAAQNHLSVAQASGDLDRLAKEANRSADGVTKSAIGTKLNPSVVSAYTGDTSGTYYYVIHNAMHGIESFDPYGSEKIHQMMLPFGVLDETVATGGNYAIVYELKSASVVAVLYSGAGNASFGNAAVINFGDDDVSRINDIYNDKSKRKSYQKGDVTAIVGCYTGKAGSAAIPTETLEAPKLEVKNENKLHVIVREAKNTDKITLVITGEQSGTTARRFLNRDAGAGDGYERGTGTFDVTLDDITGDGTYRFSQLIHEGRFTPVVTGSDFIPGENIIISAIASSTTALATPKESAKYTVSSLFDDVNETTNSNGDTNIYIKNLRHLENLGANVSGFTAALRKDTTSNSFKVVNITAEQKNDITMFSFDKLHDGQHIYGSGTFDSTYIAANVSYPLSYDGGSHEIYDLSIAPYSGRSATELNAGIFGNVTNTLSVKNLILRNDKIPATVNAANAGMLLGKTNANLTVDGVLAYYHEDTYDETRDSNVEVTASENAGGLIGLVSGGTLKVKNSAAAVYVKGGSAAGGFIGSVNGAADGSTIVQSYAGGHTKDGAYSTTDATTNQPVLKGSGRYNVQATQASGYAGGFIGVTINNVSMNAVYSTASVYSTDSTKSGSFSGNMKANFGTANNYYAIGPHNSTDASSDDTAKAEIQTGQVRRQATPYDRKLILKGSETEQKTMDKTSYPLCTVQNLCEGDTSIQDTDLPWFIKEHVGDWVVQKVGKAGFEVDNGNRLTVRIDTGLKEITGDLYYEIKVHGESSNKDKYFLLHVRNAAGDFGLVCADSVIEKTSDSNMNQQNICMIVPVKPENGTTIQTIEFYLDDITNPRGNFKSVCEGLTPGENIKISVAPAKVTGNSVSVEFDDKTAIETNSLFGYLKPSDAAEEHNINKITAVKPYYSDAGNSGLGLVLYNNTLYAQIDNARHLENLSPEISGYTYEIKGAIQTDNIYWSYESNPSLETGPDSYTKIFTKELGSNLSVYDQDGNKHNNAAGCFRPLNSNTKIELYSAWDEKNKQNYKISGVRVNEENGMAGIFAHTPVAITIQNLDIENGSFTSKSDKAGGLIANGENTVTFNSVNFTGDLTVKGQNIAGGFVAQPKGSLNITKSSINNASINSVTDKAGGLVGSTESDVTISETHITGDLTVVANNMAGGFVGQSKALNITKTSIKNASISSDTDKAGGLAGYTESDVTISETDITGTLIVEAKNIAGGFVAQPKGSLNITKSSIKNASIRSDTDKAGGLAGYTERDVTISETHITGDLTVVAKNMAGGFVGQSKSVTIKNSSINNANIVGSEDRAGGLVGYTDSDVTISETDIKGKLTVQGKNQVGGFIGQLSGNATVEKSRILNATIISNEADAGGIIGVTGTSATLNNITTDSLSVAGKSGAGGLIAKAESTVTITCAKVIGKNAVIFAEQDAGGLIGSYTSQLDVSNSAVSAFVESSEGNAGGLIGTVPGNTATSIEKSYYGGRTVAGAYGTYTFNAGTGNEKVYEANISGGANAGGLIGSIGDNPNLKVNYCFSTGSVKTKNGSVGGFVGRIGYINPDGNNMSLDHCYSMGKVFSASNDSGATKRIGGFIGQISQEEPNCTSVFYLNAFNLSSIKAIGNGKNKNGTITEISNASEILGNVASSDLTAVENTTNYDDTLDNKQYPYKNWTKSSENDLIEYYGDWPLPNKQLNGRIVYYHRISGDNTEGVFTLTGYDTSLTTTLSNKKGNFEEDGFGIICETTNREDVNKKFGYSYSLHNPSAENDGYKLLSPEGNNSNPEYSSFKLEGKDYYFFRLTGIDFNKLQSTTIFFKGGDDTIYANIIYKATINMKAYAVTFDRVE